MTPIHATELAKWPKLRSKVDVAFPRSQSSDPYPNPDKLKAKRLEMAACTNLQALYPNQPSLWGSDDQKKTNKLRDAHSDLYARRAFANERNAHGIMETLNNAMDSKTDSFADLTARRHVLL